MNWSRRAARQDKAAFALWKLRRGLTYMLDRSRHRDAISTLRARGDRFFLVHGAGWSGTQLVAALIDASAKAKVFHEPDFPDDVQVMPAIHRDADYSEVYWHRFRAARIMARWDASPQSELYGEVTGMIRHHAAVVARLFPEAQQFILTRHPSGFVRSLMGWTHFYSDTSRGAYNLAPLPGEAMNADWQHLTRFEKCCFAWHDTHDRLLRDIGADRHLRLEDIARDFTKFKDKLDRPLGLDLDEAEWHRVVSLPSPNATRRHVFPAFRDWTDEQQASLKAICGETMEALGYGA